MKIAVGLSGGVDSSVAALLLKRAGYDIFAIFMQNWNDTTGTLHGDCEWEEDLSVAKMVASKLDIPFHFVDLSEKYRERVVNYMFDEYSKGRTPNPDILCNREIKFDAFLDYAVDLGADYVVTGHYCRKESQITSDGETIYRILPGMDSNKDQSYFLCQLTQQQLSKALFPIGEMTKPQVRDLAKEAGLPSADKKDSQGICFVGKVDLPLFLQQKIRGEKGRVVEIFSDYYDGRSNPYSDITTDRLKESEDIERILEDLSLPILYKEEDGKVIGEHQGVQFYTIGQRKGLNIGGHKEPIFIISTDVANNIIYVGEGQDHKGLYRKALYIREDEIHWIREDLKMVAGESRDYLVRIRYRQPLQRATLFKMESGLYIFFEQEQRGITPGQFAAWHSYKDNEMLGSGVINQ